jgi:hypothetical protein
MTINELMSRRFSELETQMNKIPSQQQRETMDYSVTSGQWQEWATSAMHLLENSFGPESAYIRNFQNGYEISIRDYGGVEILKGIFRAAKNDFEGGYLFGFEQSLSGEIFGDFVALAKASLRDGNKDVAAVLACAALEDALKRFARLKGLAVDDKVMQEVVAALKSKGVVSGAQKALLDTMPKIRDYAMHANWDKLTSADVGSVIGFVEQFLLSNFS